MVRLLCLSLLNPNLGKAYRIIEFCQLARDFRKEQEVKKSICTIADPEEAFVSFKYAR